MANGEKSAALIVYICITIECHIITPKQNVNFMVDSYLFL